MSTLDLGIIGNCTVNASIDGAARIVWSCFPRPDGDPVFNALINDDGGNVPPPGGFSSVEIEGFASASQRYQENTAILKTILADTSGNAVEVTDFAPRFTLFDRMFCPAMLVRRIAPLHGRPRVRLRVRPVFDYGGSVPAVTRGSHHVRYVGTGQTLRLTTDVPVTYIVDETYFSIDTPVQMLLGPDEPVQEGIGDLARRLEERTTHYWREWVRPLALPLEWQDAVIRAAITLKLCTYEDTGAILAAMTTSIPEAEASGRNWDYRYCWLRDAFFVVRALNSLSDVATMENYLRFLFNVVRNAQDGRHLQPVYGIAGEGTLAERTADDLRGYRGMGPVRVGNQAHEHRQHDVYGNVILAATQAFFDKRLLRQAGAHEFEQLQWLGERAFALHDQADAGMWELRTRNSIHTSSSLMCWAACDRLARIAQQVGQGHRAAEWAERAARIRNRILDSAWQASRGAFAATFGGDDLDCGVLLLGEVGLVSPHDPRWLSTIDAIGRELSQGDFLFRYKHADDFGAPRTAFTVCTFWYIDALARSGRHHEARSLFNNLLARRNALGLLSEDIDVGTGELWGNFPQTYSMVGIINCAMRLSNPWDSVL